MANESVDRGVKAAPTAEDVFLMCQQVSGVLIALAQSNASGEDMKNALFGAHSLAIGAQDLAELLIIAEA